MRHQGGSKAIEAADVNGEKSKSGRVMTGESELKGKKKPTTESQNCWAWKRLLEAIWANSLAQAGLPRAGCPGLFSVQMAF